MVYMCVCDVDVCRVAEGRRPGAENEREAGERQALRSQGQARLPKLPPQLPHGLTAKATCQGSTRESLKLLPSVPATAPAHGGMPHPS